ncbi:GtrA family protein [Candidatus Peribacteria bacterium]|nr:MAG: GtrA family protein [Candidatus Peribacteria bacterium]
MTHSPIPCSVQVLTRNSERSIEHCLETLKDFGEVIVQDGHSTDRTVEIAKRYPNVTIMPQNPVYLDTEGRIRDFAAIRNESINAAKYDWVLVVDADEGIKPDLTEEVRRLIADDKKGVYMAFRRYYVDGTKIMYSSQYPALQIRFFYRPLIEGYQKPVHERIKVKEGVELQMLESELPVPLPPAKDLVAKNHRYLLMEAKRAENITFFGWCKWVLWRNTRTMIGVTLRLLKIWLVPREGARLPLAYEMQFQMHSLKTIIHTFPLMVRFRRLPLHARQFITYIFTGGSAAAIDIGLYLLLITLGLFYITASIISGVCGFISAFLLHKYVAFKKHDRIGNHFLRYCLLGLWNLFATTLVLYICVDIIGIPEEGAKILANASVVFWNFFLYKFLVYV